jgi:hypothetical protein
MKKVYVFVSLLLIIVCLSWIQSNSEDVKKDGKTLFIDGKCNMCHAIAKLEIEVKNKNSKAPDLGTIDMKDKSDFMMKYLVKEETMNEKKHPVKFAGTGEELKTLVDWFTEINKPAPPKN